MSMTVAQIRNAATDDALFQVLSGELARSFPAKLRADHDALLAALQAAPKGLRAMAATYELDVSMATDDLAWHFINHRDRRFHAETLAGLRELGTIEAANLFEEALRVIEPRLEELSQLDAEPSCLHDWLKSTGLQSAFDPLSERLWGVCNALGELGLLSCWLAYARKFPERCVEEHGSS